MVKFPLYAFSGYKKRIGDFYELFVARKAMEIIMKNKIIKSIISLMLALSLGPGGASSSSSNGAYSSADVELLAKVISAEARGESYEGQVAVGAVILNRVSHPSFPDSLSGVVYQKGAFSCVNDSNWYQPVAESSKRAAMDALNGWDPSGGAVYYFNPAKTNDKFMHSRTVIKEIGNHRFCI